jgi:hypothetical protein
VHVNGPAKSLPFIPGVRMQGLTAGVLLKEAHCELLRLMPEGKGYKEKWTVILAKCTFGVLDNLRARLGRDSTYSERQEVHARITAQSAGLQAALRAVKDGGDAPGVEKGVLAPHGGVLTIFHSKDSARAVVPFEKFVWADRENEAAMREHPLAAAILELREELGPTAESSCVELARGFYSKMIQDGNGMILWGRGYRFEIFDEAGNDAFIFERTA